MGEVIVAVGEPLAFKTIQFFVVAVGGGDDAGVDNARMYGCG